MKYEEIVAKVKENLSDKNISEYQKHLAIQFNITGEGEGAFYIEFKDGNINVEPYDYHDRDALVTISAENLFAILDGSLDTTAGYVDKCFDVTNLGVINEFKNVIAEAKTIVPVKETSKATEKKVTTTTENVQPKTEPVSAPKKVEEPTTKQLELVTDEPASTTTTEPKKQVKSTTTATKKSTKKTTTSKKKTSKR